MLTGMRGQVNRDFSAKLANRVAKLTEIGGQVQRDWWLYLGGNPKEIGGKDGRHTWQNQYFPRLAALLDPCVQIFVNFVIKKCDG